MLHSGGVLEADVVIAGIGNFTFLHMCTAANITNTTAMITWFNLSLCFSGVIPNSDFLAGSGVEVDSRKAVIVDKVTQAVEDIAHSQTL